VVSLPVLPDRIVFGFLNDFFIMIKFCQRCIILGWFFLLLTSCPGSGQKEAVVLIQTTLGDIEVKLFNETPLHRDNFLQLVQEGYYDNQLFHRVISEFMIQSGDPHSVGAGPDAMLGNGGPGYTVPAEFNTSFFHKKGALAAARQGDQVNPEQASSGSQFYIVQGRIWTDEELDGIEQRMNQMYQQSLFFRYFSMEQEENKQRSEPLDIQEMQQKAMLSMQEQWLNEEPRKIPEAHREVYKSIGGAPHLDESYTVFGEVTKGIETIDRIAAVPTNPSNRPLQDIRIKKVKIISR
jgi:peptidylprolyl isomerase